ADRPRRSRPKDGAFSGIIPYRNGMALAAYYCGFGSLIAILGSIALVMAAIARFDSPLILILMFRVSGSLTLLAIGFGILGLNYAHNNPKAKGSGHAITGLLMGGLEVA